MVIKGLEEIERGVSKKMEKQGWPFSGLTEMKQEDVKRGGSECLEIGGKFEKRNRGSFCVRGDLRVKGSPFFLFFCLNPHWC